MMRVMIDMASFKAAGLLLLASLLSSGGPPLAACTRVEHDGGEQIFLEVHFLGHQY